MSQQATPSDPQELILQTLRTKSCMKQDVYQRTQAMFAEMKEVLHEIAVDL